MRIDLWNGGNRSTPTRVGLHLLRGYLGFLPEPLLLISYRRGFFHQDFMAYMKRGLRAADTWQKGELEMFATFVSQLNRCHF